MIRGALTTACVLMALYATACAPPPPSVDVSPPAATPQTIGVTYHPTWAEMTDDRRAVVLDALQEAGVRWLRVDVSWKEFQPYGSDGYDQGAVEAFDKRMAEIADRGFDVLLMFYWGPVWATGTPGMNGRPADPVRFAQAAAWAVSRWGGTIDALEIWNEPDTDRFWSQTPRRTRISDFGRLLVHTSEAVRAVAPTMPVIAGGTSRVDTAWWRALLALPGVPESIDAIGVHPYTVPGDLGPRAADTGKPWRVRHMRTLRPLVERYDLAVWVTEFGWSTGNREEVASPYRRGVDERRQATYLTQALEVFADLAWVDAAFWYTDIDHNTGDPHQDGFGLLRRDGSAKPAYYAMRCAASGECSAPLNP